jgi:hypothetical protein
MSTIQVTDVPTLNQDTTGTAANVTGTVAIANGGTGQTTASAAFNALSPVTTAGDLILGDGANSATRLAIGTDGQILSSNGSTAAWGSRLAIGTAVTVSGTSVAFTGIPSWTKRITLQLYAVSTDGTSGNLTAQFGTGGTPTYVTSGYAGTSSIIRGSNSTVSAGAISSGFDLLRGLATTAFTSGTFVFTLVDSATDKWVCSALIARSDEATTIFTAGYIDLSSALTAVRLTTTTGVNSFDSGSLNILYE